MKRYLKIFILLLVSWNVSGQYCVTFEPSGTSVKVKLKMQTGSIQLGSSDIAFSFPAGLTYSSVVRAPGIVAGYDLINDMATATKFIVTIDNARLAGAITIGATDVDILTVNFTGVAGAGTYLNLTSIPFKTYVYDNTSASEVTAGAACDVVLPTELISFKGNRKGKESQLQWEATNEKNIVNYIVERSTDGRNFHPIGFNKPKSFNATEKVAYDFIDDSPEIGINYYRLLSKGYGKDEKYSKVISLDFGLGLSGRVFPNPLDGDLTVEMDIESNSGDVEVGVYDVVGKQVLSKKMQNSDRRINFVMPTTDLPPGAYIIKIKVGTTYWERKLTKM